MRRVVGNDTRGYDDTARAALFSRIAPALPQFPKY